MKKSKWIVLISLCILLFSATASANEPKQIRHGKWSHGLNYRKDEILVKSRDSRKPSSQKTFQAKSGFTTLKTYKRSGIRRIKITNGMDVDQALDIYYNDPDVEYAEPNYIYHAATVPNDTHFSKQWALENSPMNVKGVSINMLA